MKLTRARIDSFLAERRLAIVGASRGGRGFGNVVMKALGERGYDVAPVHPSAATIDGRACAASLSALPAPVGGVVVAVPPAEAAKVLEGAASAGIRKAWLVQGSSSAEALRVGAERGVEVVHEECILLFVEPVQGVHRFHRWLWKIFGKLPAESARV